MNITKIYETNSQSSNPLPVLMTALERRKHTTDKQSAFRFYVFNPASDWDKLGDPAAGGKRDDLIEVTWSPSDDELMLEHWHGEEGIDRETIIIDGGRMNPSITANVINVIERMFRRAELN